MGMAIMIGEDRAGKKFVCGNRHYEVDKEGMIYVLDSDAQGFRDSGYKPIETKKKPIIANEKDLKDIPITTKTAVEEKPVEEKKEEVKVEAKEEVKVEEKVEAKDEAKTEEKSSDKKPWERSKRGGK